MANSMINNAFEILTKSTEPVSFKELWSKVLELEGLDATAASSSISKFYTSLCIDGRFIGLADNTWTIRDRVTVNQIDKVKNTDSFESTEEDVEEENEENEIQDDSNSKDEDTDEDSSSNDENID